MRSGPESPERCAPNNSLSASVIKPPQPPWRSAYRAMPDCRGGVEHAGRAIYLWVKSHSMVYAVSKRTTKRQLDSILQRAGKRSRKKKGADFSDLVGSAPLHKDPVKFQRALRDEE